MHRSARLVLAAATFAVAAPLATSVAASTAPPDSGAAGDDAVVLVDPGDEESAVLLVSPDIADLEVGETVRRTERQSGNGEVTGDGVPDGEGTFEGSTVVTETELVGTDDEAGRTTEFTIESIDSDGDGPLAEEIFGEDERLPLVGRPMLATYDGDGALVMLGFADEQTVTDEEQAALDYVIAEGSDGRDVPPFPDQPVGVGARWTTTLGALDNPIPVEFELTELTDTSFTATADVSAAVAEGLDFGDGSTFTTEPTALVTITGSLPGEPVSFDLVVDLDVAISSPDGAQSLAMELQYGVTVTVDEATA